MFVAVASVNVHVHWSLLFTIFFFFLKFNTLMRSHILLRVCSASPWLLWIIIILCLFCCYLLFILYYVAALCAYFFIPYCIWRNISLFKHLPRFVCTELKATVVYGDAQSMDRNENTKWHMRDSNWHRLQSTLSIMLITREKMSIVQHLRDARKLEDLKM